MMMMRVEKKDRDGVIGFYGTLDLGNGSPDSSQVPKLNRISLFAVLKLAAYICTHISLPRCLLISDFHLEQATRDSGVKY